MKVKTIFIFLGDLILLCLSLLFVIEINDRSLTGILERYQESLLLFMLIWILVSFVSKKYISPGNQRRNIWISSFRIAITSLIVLGIISTLMYLFRVDYFSRFVVFGTLFTLSLAELLLTAIYYSFKNASSTEPPVYRKHYKAFKNKEHSKLFREGASTLDITLPEGIAHQRSQAILESLGKEGLAFVETYAPIKENSTLVLSTITYRTIQLMNAPGMNAFVNLERVNDFRYINKFFEAVNHQLPKGGIFIDYFEEKNQRKRRILKKFPPVINYIYYSFDYLIKRVFPKFMLTKQIYFILTRGNNRVLTKAEAFGRLYSCGFELIEELETREITLFAAIKTKKPLYPVQPTYGPLIKLKRVGKKGKIIEVYKIRTMHPYSEFIQEYVYKKEGLNEGGKFKSDFRVSTLGRFFRALWLDELPMLLNVVKGELKIVGVRPLSEHYFKLYSEEHRERRIKYRPGLIPPFYVDNPKTLEEITASEKKYFDLYDKHPLRTDLSYFFRALYNILFKHARSA
ncbi:MAG: sugar transferase [Bacteroidota bacterium]|nr:MAG: sugar transferase [Bacteroidota bacterium]